jgi:hypothetical protein
MQTFERAQSARNDKVQLCRCATKYSLPIGTYTEKNWAMRTEDQSGETTKVNRLRLQSC